MICYKYLTFVEFSRYFYILYLILPSQSSIRYIILFLFYVRKSQISDSLMNLYWNQILLRSFASKFRNFLKEKDWCKRLGTEFVVIWGKTGRSLGSSIDSCNHCCQNSASVYQCRIKSQRQNFGWSRKK